MTNQLLIDTYGRQLDYLRLSVTDRCNLRCQYCMPQEGINFVPRNELLSYEEMLRLARIFKSMGVRRIGLVALHAEGEVLAPGAVEAEHLLWDGLHAFITAEPKVVAVLDQLLLRGLLGLLCDALADTVFELALRLVLSFEVLVRVLIDKLTSVLKQVQVDRFVHFNLVLILVSLILVVLLVEHFRHGLVVDVGDELGLELALHSFNQALVLEKVALGQIVSFLDLVEDLLALESLELGELLLALLLEVFFALFGTFTRQLSTTVLAPHRLVFIRVSRVRCDRARVRIFKPEVVLRLEIVHLVFPDLIFLIDEALALLERFLHNSIRLPVRRRCSSFLFPALVQNVAPQKLLLVVQLVLIPVKSRQ